MKERYEIDRQQETNWSKESVVDREKIKLKKFANQRKMCQIKNIFYL
jgi:hypothetical protein